MTVIFQGKQLIFHWKGTFPEFNVRSGPQQQQQRQQPQQQQQQVRHGAQEPQRQQTLAKAQASVQHPLLLPP